MRADFGGFLDLRNSERGAAAEGGRVMKVWKLIPGKPVEELEVTYDQMRFAHEVINATMDITRVRYLGKLRLMAVDDEGMCKSLPVNEEATKAYHANCKPGTVWPICGPAVIFERTPRT